MSEFDYDGDLDNDGPGGLRRALEKAQKAAKDAIARAEKAEADRAEALKSVRSQSLTSLLRDKGVKPALAKWLEKDDVDATPEAVDAWLKENGEFFNVKPAEPSKEVQAEDNEPQGQPNIPEGMEAAIRASQSLDASGVSPSEVDAVTKIRSVDTDPYKVTEEQLREQLAALGVEFS